jgi:hypothetical protein
MGRDTLNSGGADRRAIQYSMPTRSANMPMSGPIVRSGATPQFSKNWENIFGKPQKSGGSAGATAAKKKAAKKPAAAKKKAAKSAPKKAASKGKKK